MMITAVYFQARPRWCFQTCLLLVRPDRDLCKIWGRGLFYPWLAVGPSLVGLGWTGRNSESAARLVR